MSLLTLSHPTYILNPPVIRPRPGHTSTVPTWNPASGSCTSVRWVPNSHKNLSNCLYPFHDSRFIYGFWNVGKRVTEACVSFRNGGSLVRVWSGGLEIETEIDDAYYIRRCVELARQAIGNTSPNPMVGCVIVKDGKVVGEGFHPKAGEPHAEVFALRNAGELAEDATAYVSLEPCNHYGRTPPCTEALINAKVKKVVIGMVDPNPMVSSKGIQRLREAGIQVTVGIEEDLCKRLNEAFIHKMLYGNLFVTVRYSISINGMFSDQLSEGVVDCGGYYSKLLQEYDAVIHSPAKTTRDFSFSASQEPNARQPMHICIAKNTNSLIRVVNLSAEQDCKAIIFANKEVAFEQETSKMGYETVIMNQLSLNAILEYCSKQGFCSVMVDLRGNVDDFEEILAEGLEKNLLQKIVVEVLPLWVSREEEDCSLNITSLTQKMLRSLSSKESENSLLLEGYF